MQPPNLINKWWKPVESAFAGLGLKGLNTTCPQCDESGFVTTRWVKGPLLKPVYILHLKRNKVIKTCQLTPEQAEQVRGKVPILEKDIKNILQFRKTFVLFSGGKDSLATLIYLKEVARHLRKRITAIYVDTTAGLPENTQYVKKVCKYMKVKLEIVKPKEDYFSLVKKWGIPSFQYR